jgi:hypothetical protein
MSAKSPLRQRSPLKHEAIQVASPVKSPSASIESSNSMNVVQKTSNRRKMLIGGLIIGAVALTATLSTVLSKKSSSSLSSASSSGNTQSVYTESGSSGSSSVGTVTGTGINTAPFEYSCVLDGDWYAIEVESKVQCAQSSEGDYTQPEEGKVWYYDYNNVNEFTVELFSDAACSQSLNIVVQCENANEYQAN